MDKLKNLVSPGHKKDDEVLYGEGKTDDLVLSNKSTVSGQGSHFPHGSSATGGPQTYASNPTSTEYSSGLREPPPSRMPGAFDDETATTTSVKSGVPGTSQMQSKREMLDEMEGQNRGQPLQQSAVNTHLTGIGGTSTGTDHSGTMNTTGAGSHFGASRSTGSAAGTYDPSSLGTTGAEAHPGRDKSVDFGVADVSGTSRENYDHSSRGTAPTGTSGTSMYSSGGVTPGSTGDNFGRSVAGTGPTSTFGTGGFSASEPTTTSTRGSTGHSSATTGPTATSTDTGYPSTGSGGLSNTPLGVGSTTHDSSPHGHLGHHDMHSVDPSNHTRHTALGARTEAAAHPHDILEDASGRSFPLGGSSTQPSSSTAGPHSSSLANQADPRIDSDRDGRSGLSSGLTGSSSHPSSHLGPSSTTPGHYDDASNRHHGREGLVVGGAGAAAGGAYAASRDPSSSETGPASATAGPHKSDMMNKADPRVDSDLSKQTGGSSTAPGSSQPTSTLGYTQPSGVTSSHPQTGYHTGPVGTAVGGTSETYGDTTYQSTQVPSSSTQSAPRTGPSTSNIGVASTTGAGTGSTAGPHSSSVANKADPRVDSDRDGRSGLSSGPVRAGYGSTVDDGHRRGHEAGFTGAAGAAGAEAYGADRGVGSHGIQDADRTYGSSHQPATHSSGIHGGPLGTSQYPPSTTGSSDPYSRDSRDHSNRDAALGAGLGAGAGAGAGGLAAHEYNKHEPRGHESVQQPATSATGAHTTSGSHGPGADLTKKLAHEYDMQKDPATSTSTSAAQPTGATNDHTGRNAALGAGAGAGTAGVAAHEYEKHRTPQTDTTTSGAQPSRFTEDRTDRDNALGAGTGSGVTGLAGTDHGRHGAPLTETSRSAAQPTQQADDHVGRNAALGAGAGAGAAGLAAHEYNEKEAEKAEKAHQKEMKQAEKEHEKEMKHAEKEHQKEVKHAEKAHEKDAKKHEHHDDSEKKPGLMDRLLHRHQDDNEKDAKKDETPLHDPDTRRDVLPSHPKDKNRTDDGLTQSETPTGPTGPTTLDPEPRSHGEPHDGIAKTTHDAYDTSEGQNKLHKEPPAKVLKEHGLQ